MTSLDLIYNSFVSRISEVNRRDIYFKLSQRSLIALIAATAITFAVISLEAIFSFSAIVRTYIFFAFISSCLASLAMIGILAWRDWLAVSQPERIKRYAKKIGTAVPEVKDRLVNAVELYNEVKNPPGPAGIPPKRGLTSGELAIESIRQVDEETRGKDFSGTISFRKNNRLILLLAGMLVVFTSMFLIFPNVFQAAAYRMMNYNYNFIENTLGIFYEVTPGNVEVPKGSDVEIIGRIRFNDPNYTTEHVNFYTRELTSPPLSRLRGENDSPEIEIGSSSERLSASSVNEFKTVVPNITSTVVYWFEYKGVRSEEYRITVTPRPVIKSLKITVYPPAYTRLPSRLVDGSEISTIVGSTVYVEVESADEISGARVEFGEGENVKLELSSPEPPSSEESLREKGETKAVGSFTVMKNGNFRVIISKEGLGTRVPAGETSETANLKVGVREGELTNLNPPNYNVHVFPDEYPKVSIIEPLETTPFNSAFSKGEYSTKEVLVTSRITDDFGFTKLRLGYKLSKSKYGFPEKDYQYTDIPVKNLDATGVEVSYMWNLSPLNLATEDEVEYFVEVFDNDAVSGPKSSKSEIRKIVMPSLESLLKKTEKSKEEIESALNTAYQEAMELKEELDEIKDKLEKNPEELGLNDPKKNQELRQKIENSQNQFNSVQQKLNELMNELQSQNQISQETLEKYMELQKLFERIDSPELREMLKKLQEALREMNKDKLMEALRNFKFDEEAFKKSIEKTMELLQKILNEQKFGELTKKLDELAKRQEELKNQTEKTDESDKNKLNEISKSQEQLRKEYEEFQKQLKELLEKMKKLQNDEITKQLEKMLKEMQKKMLEQKMNEASKNLQNGDKNQSLPQQQQLSNELQNMNQMLQDLLAQMMDQENSKMMAKMMEMLSKLQEMSQKQGELKEQSSNLDKDSEPSEFQQNAREQKDLAQELSKTIDEMMSLSGQMPMTPMLGKLLGDAYNEMGKATEQLGKKDAKGANKSQGNAKESLDKAIEKFQSMCQSGNKPGRGSSLSQLLQMLQQLIERQQALNQGLNQLGQQGNQGQYTQEQLAQMQRLKMEQETIRKSLQQLNEEFKKQQELEGKKLLGNLEEVQKDMMEVIKDLQDRNITPETRKRQEKILSRMLDFQLSQREKDFEKKRESRPGKDYDRSSPTEIVISRPNIIEGVNQDVLELQKQSFNEDYEILIQKYMERVKRVR
jgi:hypothetical protein